jgi:hypothetical protein
MQMSLYERKLTFKNGTIMRKVPITAIMYANAIGTLKSRGYCSIGIRLRRVIVAMQAEVWNIHIQKEK